MVEEEDQTTDGEPSIPHQSAPPFNQAKFQIGGSDDGFEDQLEEDNEDEDEEDIPIAVVPPDGGWGWVVVGASFLCNVVVDGIIFTSGNLFDELQKEFNATKFQVAWIASLLGGFYLLAGPFVSGLANAYGFRTVTILGSIVSCLACLISRFATSLEMLYFTYGILGGIGFGLIYVPAVISTGFYFEKKRAFATGVAVCGSGVGTFFMAPITTNILSLYSWRECMLAYSGLSLTCGIFGLAFRPLTASTGKTRRVDEDDDQQPPRTPLLLRIKRARDEQLRQCASALSMTPFSSRNNSKVNLEESLYPQLGFGDKAMNGNASGTRLDRQNSGGQLNKRSSVPALILTAHEPIAEEEAEQVPESSQESQANENNIKAKLNQIRPLDVAKLPPLLDNNKNETEKSSNGKSQVRYPRIESAPAMSLSPYRLTKENARRSSKTSLKLETSRPFYRDDIFYSGSLRRLPEYRSSDTIEKYHESVTNLPPLAVVEEEHEDLQVIEEGKCCWCLPASAGHTLKKMFDFSLFTSITFSILGLAGFMTLLALFVPFNFLPSYAKELGIADNDASFLLSLIGICNTVGRIVCGFISDRPNIDALQVNNISLILGGISTMLLPFLKDLSLLYAYALVFGFSVAAFASLRSILLVELLGLEKLTNAFGLLLLCQGVAATFGSPVAGAFNDATAGHDIGFYVFGAVFALSGAICIPLRRIKAWEDGREERKRLKEQEAEAA